MKCKFVYGGGYRCGRDTHGEDLCHYHYHCVVTKRMSTTRWYNIDQAWCKKFLKSRKKQSPRRREK